MLIALQEATRSWDKEGAYVRIAKEDILVRIAQTVNLNEIIVKGSYVRLKENNSEVQRSWHCC